MMTIAQAFKDVNACVRSYRGTADDHEHLTTCLQMVADHLNELEKLKKAKEPKEEKKETK